MGAKIRANAETYANTVFGKAGFIISIPPLDCADPWAGAAACYHLETNCSDSIRTPGVAHKEEGIPEMNPVVEFSLHPTIHS